jgi:DNA polymerase I
MGFKVLHGIVDCLWVMASRFQHSRRPWRRRLGILTEVDTYDWITFLPMSDGGGAYNRYFGRLNTGKMKIRGVMARKVTLLSMSTKCNKTFSRYWPRQGAWRTSNG